MMRPIGNIVGLTAALFAVAVGVRGVPCRGAEPHKVADSDVFVQVASLFADGEEGVDQRVVRSMITSCLTSHAVGVTYADQPDEYAKQMDSLLDYLESHRVEAADISALREWQGMSLECVDDSHKKLAETTAAKMSSMSRTIWNCVQNEADGYQPRHAVLFSAVSILPVSYPQLGQCVVKLQRVGRRMKALQEGSELGVVEKFLLDKQNQPLVRAIEHDLAALARACNSDDPFKCDELTQALLDNRNDPAAFSNTLTALRVLSINVVKAVPSFGIGERYGEVQRLRAIWNIVHAYGDANATELTSTAIVKLRDEFKKMEDAPTVKWLEDVMAKPGRPFEKYLQTIIIKVQKPQESQEP